jgi:hypothetical protein
MVFNNHPGRYGWEDLFSVNVPGGHTGGATPVPIPNTEVKPSKADATAAVRQWESRTLPGYNKGPLVERSAGLFFSDKDTGVPRLSCSDTFRIDPFGLGGRKPSGIPSAANMRSQCFGQFQLSYPAESR